MDDAARLDDLRVKLKGRINKPGFEDNVQQIKREIEALEAELKGKRS